MKKSARARRLARHHKRLRNANKLNLVSLMDIFTILVFFLMVNSSDVQVLQSNKQIKLPESIAEQKPEETLVIAISASHIVVGGRPVVAIDEIGSEQSVIEPLKAELNFQASKRPQMSEAQQLSGRAVTIMGDASLHYQLLKQVMATCAITDFRDISLAVTRIASAAGGEVN